MFAGDLKIDKIVVKVNNQKLKGQTEIDYNSETKTVYIDPESNFNLGEIVNITLTNQIQTLLGDPIEPFNWLFMIEVLNGSGLFAEKTDFSVGNKPIAAYPADFNNDQYIDLVTANINSGDVSVILGNGDGTFVEKVDYIVGNEPKAIISSDLNNDGNMDIISATSGIDMISVLLGIGNGAFTEKADYAVGDYPVYLYSSLFFLLLLLVFLHLVLGVNVWRFDSLFRC